MKNPPARAYPTLPASGDRTPKISPEALQTLVFHKLMSADEAARFTQQTPAQNRPLESVVVALPRLLEELDACMRVERSSEIVTRCLTFLGVTPRSAAGDRRRVTPRTLLSRLAWTLLGEDDSEGCIVTANLFSLLLEESEREDADERFASVVEFLSEISQRYVESTRYLVALLSEYARHAVATGQRLGIDRCVLFLRDGLTFWPAVRAIDARGKGPTLGLDYLVYTRPLRETHRSPLLVRGRGSEREIGPMAPLSRALLLDVGIYGTLIKSLHDDKFLERDNKVLFVGSRNPHIEGFLEVGAGAPALAQSDMVALVDTIECMLKPFQLVTRDLGARAEVFVRMGDPISFVCAARFMRELFAFTGSDPWHSIKRGAWHLEDPIPVWSGAERFIESWSVPSCVPGR